jgi:dolichyl-phosphate-mannose-protein mannosyltransferase
VRQLRTAYRRVFDFSISIVLALITLGLALPHDVYRRFSANSDGDLIYVYNALLMNDGLPLYYHSAAYVYILFLAGWFQVGHALGLLDVSTLTGLINSKAVLPQFAQLVFAARWTSIVMAAFTSTGFYLAVRWLTGNRVAAAAVALLFAVSPGLGVHAWQVDKDLMAMIFSFAAFFFIVRAARTRGDAAFLFVAAAAFMMMLGMMSKVQVIFLALAFPVTAFFFGEKSAPRPPSDVLGNWRRLAVTLGALAFAVPAQVMIWTNVYRIKDPVEPLAHYQVLTALYLAIAVIAYARFFRGNGWRDALPGLAAVAVGVAAGMYVFFLYPDGGNVLVLANPIQRMMLYVGTSSGEIVAEMDKWSRVSALIAKGLVSAWQTLERDFSPSGDSLYRPVYWAVAVGLMGAAFLREWGIVVRAGALLAIALGMEAFSGVRGWDGRYNVYTEPWVFLAGAYLLAAADRRWRLFVRPLGTLVGVRRVAAAAIAVFAVVMTVQGGAAALQPRPWELPERACYIASGYMPLIFNYFCPVP